MDEGLIQISVDLPRFNAWASAAIARQIPYATARALTMLAKGAQTEIRSTLGAPGRFRLRSTWTARGIRIVPADKRDYPAVQAIVGSVDEYLVLQETGGTKTSATGRRVAIPAKIPASRRGALGVPKSIKPSPLIERGRGFIDERGDLLVRNAKGSRFIGPRRPPAVYFFLRASAHIRPRLGFRDQATKYLSERYGEQFSKELQAALEKGTKPRT